jgi:putative ABC transport system permease protein
VNRTKFVLAMAWRESRAARRRLLLLTASVTVGVAALVAINSFTDNLRSTAQSQARVLLGADIQVRGHKPFSPRAEKMVDSVAGCPALPCPSVSTVISFAAMAYVPRTEGTRLVQVEGIEGTYPFYGSIRTEPREAWERLQSGRNVIVDPSLLAALNARAGDSLALGEARFVITGTIVDVPGDVGVRTAFGPRVYVAGQQLAATGLLVAGSRYDYEKYLKIGAGDPQAMANRLRPALAEELLTVRTVADDQANMDRALDQLGRYLGLVALIALLLGGLGVASAVHVFIRRKLETIAILRCLGAGSGQLFLVYLLQAGGMGLIGSTLGALAGIILQLALPRVLADFLPVDVAFSVSWPAVLTGLGTGFLVSILFALLPLLGVRRVSPLVVLRRPFEEIRRPGIDFWKFPVYLLLAASVIGLAALQVGNLVSGLAFAVGIGIILGTLALAAFLLSRALRRWFPRRLPYLWRQGLANLYRPANQTLSVLLSLGFGTVLLSTLYLVQANLLHEFRVGASGPRANLVFFDIQPDQRHTIEDQIRAGGHALQPAVPIVPMRILSVKGRPLAAILRDSNLVGEDGQPLGRWAFRREFRSTYRDTTVASERIVLGRWWTPGRADTAVVPISVEVEVAGELGVTVGDTMVWDVQGLPVTTRIANLRKVDWARFEPNFFVVFPEGPLSDAPQMYVVLTRVPDPAGLGRLQRQVIERFPNVTAIDLTQIQASLERLINRVVLVIRFMALFSLATGAVVLVGAVATSRYQRVREGVLLKTLGATRWQIGGILAVEYLALGSLAVLTALLLSGGAGWVIMKWVFDTPFAIPLGALAWLALGVVGLTLAVGLASSLEVLGKTPLEVLRTE